jgi:hypothetical protein
MHSGKKGGRKARKWFSQIMIFSIFVRYFIPQLRIKLNMKPVVILHFSGLQSENFGESVSLFWLWKCQLWMLISRVLLGFCSAYIYSFERFFSQLFNGVHGNLPFSSFLVIDENVKKIGKKHINLKLFGLALVSVTICKA